MTQPYTLSIEVPGLPKSMNARLHWRARHRENRKWANLVDLLVRGKRPKVPLQRARLTITRCSSVAGDYDNTVASAKPLIDALVTARVIEDDSMRVIGVPIFKWEKAPPRHGSVRIEVVEERKETE